MAALPIEQVLPSAIIQKQMNTNYAGLGNWYTVVNGLLVPNEAVRFMLPQPTYDRVRQDARSTAIASFPVTGDEYAVEIDVPTIQPDLEETLTGKVIKDLATTNTARKVGNLATVTTTAHAEFYCLKATVDGGGVVDVEIPRTDYTNLKAASIKAFYYDPSAETATDVTTMTPAGALSYPDDNSLYIGNIHITDFKPTPFTWDSNTPVKVTFSSGADRITIDEDHTDPALSDGDLAIIVGITYSFQQIATGATNSLSYLYTLLKEHRVSLDFFMGQGRSETSSNWLARHIYRAKLSNIPDFGETRGDKGEHNFRTFRFEIDRRKGQNVTAVTVVGDLFDEELIRYPLV